MSLEGESCLALESGVVPPHSLRAEGKGASRWAAVLTKKGRELCPFGEGLVRCRL